MSNTGLPRLEIGMLVRTPTGRVGRIKKIRGHASRRDYFIRVEVQFGQDYYDSVQLQPRLLIPFTFIPE